MKTRTIFRKFPEGDVIALFPALAGDNNPWTCSSYQHIGQHGAASVDLPRFTKPASPKEYASLKRELISIGYKVKIAKRFTASDLANRQSQLRN